MLGKWSTTEPNSREDYFITENYKNRRFLIKYVTPLKWEIILVTDVEMSRLYKLLHLALHVPNSNSQILTCFVLWINTWANTILLFLPCHEDFCLLLTQSFYLNLGQGDGSGNKDACCQADNPGLIPALSWWQLTTHSSCKLSCDLYMCAFAHTH